MVGAVCDTAPQVVHAAPQVTIGNLRVANLTVTLVREVLGVASPYRKGSGEGVLRVGTTGVAISSGLTVLR